MAFSVSEIRLAPSAALGAEVERRIAQLHPDPLSDKVKIGAVLDDDVHRLLEQRAIDYAWEHNVLVVVAAGNSGVDTATYGPAASAHVLTVGASDANDKHAGFSNWGASVDLVAPGIDVLSLRARQTDFAMVAGLADYTPGDWFVGPQALLYRASGTSFAAPLVTGVASLVIAKTPAVTAADLQRILTQSARDIDVPGVDQFTGYGLLDARAALTQPAGFFLEVGIAGVEVVHQLIRKEDGEIVSRARTSWRSMTVTAK